jgi:hypothetical protein
MTVKVKKAGLKFRDLTGISQMSLIKEPSLRKANCLNSTY